MDAAELRDGVVAVLEEDALVELLGAAQADGGVDGGVAGEVEVADELVEEQAAQALVAARVPGEERALHDLGQVDEREDRPVEVREVRAKDLGFVGGEALGHVLHGHLLIEADGTGTGSAIGTDGAPPPGGRTGQIPGLPPWVRR